MEEGGGMRQAGGRGGKGYLVVERMAMGFQGLGGVGGSRGCALLSNKSRSNWKNSLTHTASLWNDVSSTIFTAALGRFFFFLFLTCCE